MTSQKHLQKEGPVAAAAAALPLLHPPTSDAAVASATATAMLAMVLHGLEYLEYLMCGQEWDFMSGTGSVSEKTFTLYIEIGRIRSGYLIII